ncbi:MAG: alpha-amylase family glycosyl hydrolase [Bacteroidales bacterium]
MSTKKIFFLLLSLIPIGVFSQVITVSPTLPTASNAVFVTFDATEASKTDLLNYTGDVYVHTGVKIEGNTEWQYVIGTWGNNSTQPKLTRTGTNTYTLSISPSIREFYGVPSETKITQLCFVFRSSDGSKQTEDISYDVYEQGLNVSITNPTQNKPIYELNDNFDITLEANNSTSLKLLIDNVEVQSTTESSITYNYTASNYGKHWFKAIASDGSITVADSTYILVRSDVVEEELPSGLKLGVNIIDQNTVTIVLNDPPALKSYVYIIGNFTDWLPDDQYYMKRTPDKKYFWLTINNLEPSTDYAFQFLIDGYLHIADPYTSKTLDPNDQYISSTTYPNLMDYPSSSTSGIISTFTTNPSNYAWQVSNFTPPAKEKLVIYELHIRDFVEDGYIQSVIDTLNYLQNLGVSAIELMPISEFEGNDSWGYNPSFYFAADKAYGTANDYKEFIDECHKRGIAVIMDMVLNHSYGQSPLVQMYSNSDGTTLGTPTSDNPWYNLTSPNTSYSWGYDFNHENLSTQQFVDSVVSYWLTEYRFDGFRFDFTKGFTNTAGDGWAYDASRIAILKRIADKIWSVNSNAYVILEHFTDNSEEKELANYGMMIWGNLNYNYNQATMGYTSGSSLSNIAYTIRGWNNPNLVGYMESHDEERLMYNNLTSGNTTNPNHNVTQLAIALKRVELAANFFIPIPGPKMIWQFGELGYDVSIDYNGRTGAKPLHWEYYDVTERKKLYQVFAHLNKLKQTYEAFSTTSFECDLSSTQKWIKLDGADMDVVIMGNFDIDYANITVDFPTTGKWYEYYSRDSIDLTTTSKTINLAPAGYRLYTSKKIDRDGFVGIDDNNINSQGTTVNVWPNPSNGSFKLLFNNTTPSVVKVEIYNLLGQQVYSENKYYNAGENYVDIVLPSNSANGMYIYKVTGDGFKSSGKISIYK